MEDEGESEEAEEEADGSGQASSQRETPVLVLRELGKGTAEGTHTTPMEGSNVAG